MKKLLALLLAISMLLCFAACGESEDKDKDENKGDKNESTSQKEDSSSKKDDSIYAESYEEFMDNMCKFYAGDADMYKTCFPIAYWNYILEQEETNEKAVIEELETQFADSTASMEEQFGKNLEYKVETVSKEKLSNEEIEKMGAALNSYCDIIEADLLTDGYKSVVKATVKGDKAQESNDTECYIVEYDGYWYSIRYFEEDGKAFFREP